MKININKKILLLVLAGFFLIFFLRHFFALIPAEQILPAGPLIYLRAADLPELQQELEDCRLWQKISALDQEKILGSSGLDEKTLEKYKQVKASLTDFAAHPALKKILVKEAAIAFYPDPARLKNKSRSWSGPIIIFRIRPGIDPAELLIRSAQRSQEKISVSKQVYAGKKIVTLEFQSGIRVSCTVVRNLFCAAFTPEPVKACIDAGQKKISRLCDSPQFFQAFSRLPDKGDFYFYVQADRMFFLQEKLRSFAAAGNKNNDSDLPPGFADFSQDSPVTAWAGVLTLGDPLETKTVIVLKAEKQDFASEQGRTAVVRENPCFSFCPPEIVGYQWGDLFSLSRLGENMAERKGRSLQGYLSGLVNDDLLQEISASLAGGGGFVIQDISTGLVPFPRGCFFAEIKEDAEVQGLIRKFLKKNNICLNREEYRDVSLNYYSFPFLSGFEPGFCIWQKYLFIFTSSSFLKQCIDIFLDKNKPLLRDPLFKTVSKGLREKNNYSCFFRPAVLADRLQNVLARAGDWFSLSSLQTRGYGQSLEYEIDSIREQLAGLEEEISFLEQQIDRIGAGPDQEAEVKVNKLRSQLAEKKSGQEKIILNLKHLEQDYQLRLSESSAAENKALLFKLYFQELISPLLEGFKQYQAFSLRMISDPEAIEVYCLISKKRN